MNPAAHLESAWRYWRTQPLRALLSMLGIAVGIAGFMVVIALSEGARREIAGMMSLFGTDTLIVDAGVDKGMRAGFTHHEMARLQTLLAPALASFAPVRMSHAEVEISGRRRRVRIIATTPSYAEIHRLQVRHGRFLAWLDEARRLRTCVVSPDLAPRGSMQVPLRFQDGRLCHIRGVLAPGSLGEADTGGVSALPLESTVIMPLSAWNTDRAGGIDQLQLKLRDERLVPAVARLLEHRFAHRGSNTGPAVLVPDALLHQKRRWHQRLEQFLLGVATIVLGVGVAGMSNVMLVSVDSRRREIGLRRAVGASRRDILLQFLLEGLLLAAAGGLAGALLGTLLSRVLHALLDVAVIQAPALVLAGGLLALLAGVLASLYPAFRAARLDPAEALRNP